jgi:putative resolvase
MDNYKTRSESCEILGIHYKTLYKLAENKEIESVKIGQRQLYNIKKYLNKIKVEKSNKKNICYCRVSSSKQKEDLERQINFMKGKFPDYEIIKDIGSGINLNREGLKKIIDLSINGEINELVIAYKDRLARFGYDMIERIIKDYSNGKIIIINKDEEQTPTEELTKDIVSIMKVYVAKINGLRKYKSRMKKVIKKK